MRQDEQILYGYFHAMVRLGYDVSMTIRAAPGGKAIYSLWINHQGKNSQPQMFIGSDCSRYSIEDLANICGRILEYHGAMEVAA